MSILVDENTTFLVQGITGREAVNLTRECLDYGSKIVGGVTPGKGGTTTAGAPITASNSGKVVYADDLGIYGGCVLVDHGFDLFTLYGHLSRIDVKPGDMVKKGQAIAKVGNSGGTAEPQLHFEVRRAGKTVDPTTVLPPQ